MKKIVIIGGGGHAKVLISVLKKIKNYETIGYIDLQDKGPILGVAYLGNDDMLRQLVEKNEQCCAAIGLGAVSVSEKRKELKDFAQALGFLFPPITSPCSIVNEEVRVGGAVMIFDGVVINSGSEVGEGAIINTNSTIEHDCTIGRYVHIAPGTILSGNVNIGDYSFVGAGSVVKQNVYICPKSLIGAASTIIKDINEPGVYAGNPVRRLR